MNILFYQGTVLSSVWFFGVGFLFGLGFFFIKINNININKITLNTIVSQVSFQ